jgi:hypothetical protein
MAVAPAEVRADSNPALIGAAWLTSEVGCFTKPAFSNRVTNTACSGGRSWLTPITLSWTGNTVFRASGAGAGAAPACRFVLRSAGDGSVALGGQVSVTSTDNLLGSFSVPAVSTTGHIDCILQQNGRGLTAVRWNAN